jgi:prolyl-tRNA editing enzyme YbaK/EbsC (Cys-tRNA(Pro) deacylase)
LRVGERVVLIVASGRWRMDNRKVKALFGGKPKMLGVDEVAAITGHEVGGVCPFGLKTPLPVYCDVSSRAFDEVVPAAGSTHRAADCLCRQNAEDARNRTGAACSVKFSLWAFREPARPRSPPRLRHC